MEITYTLFEIKTWKKFVNNIQSYEDLLRKRLIELFEKQKQDYLKYLKKQTKKEFKVEDLIPKNYDTEEFIHTFKIHYESMAANRRFIFNETYAGAFNFTVGKTQKLFNYIEEMPIKISELIQNHTENSLKFNLAEAIKKGKSPEEFASIIEKEFDFAKTVRAKRIARTEMAKTANFSDLETWKDSDIVEQKSWLSALDERARTPHLEAHGQKVALNDTFSVGGEALEYPGDFNGSPGNIINCRCTMIADMEKPPEEPTSGIENTSTNWEDYGEWEESLDTIERDLIAEYTGNKYEAYNTYLRTGDFPNTLTTRQMNKYKNEIRELQELIKNAYKDDTSIVYRGIRNIDPEDFKTMTKINNTIELKGFSSTTLDKDIASRFALRAQKGPSYERAVFKIIPKKGGGGVPIEKLSYSKKEKEILYNMNKKFKVKEVKTIERHHTKIKQITLEEI